MGGSNGEGRRHHHGDGGQRNMATYGIQRPDRARKLTTTTVGWNNVVNNEQYRGRAEGSYQCT